jgi:hypothetical protein
MVASVLSARSILLFPPPAGSAWPHDVARGLLRWNETDATPLVIGCATVARQPDTTIETR